MLKYYLKRDPSEGLTLILPGLPAVVSKQCDDIARACAETDKRTVAALHYPGIGLNVGKDFLFSDSLALVTETIEHLKSEYENIWVFGHSWGGFNALRNLIILEKHLSKMVCASPYLGYRDLGMAEDLMRYFLTDYPTIFQRNREDLLREDFSEHGLQYGLLNTQLDLSRLKQPLTILQATKDTTTPADIARFMFADLKNCDYKELDDDHGFSVKRRLFIAQIVAAL